MAKFILDEDEALLYHLRGLKVTDRTAPEGGRDVKVWFRLPEEELQERTYPYMTIDLIGINHATDREHRGYLRYRDPHGDLPYDVDGAPEPTVNYAVEGAVGTGTMVEIEYPIPYDLVYQITTWARFAWHDRQIVASLMATGKIPHRFGQLTVKDTVRRLDLVSVVVADTVDENNKRLFRKIYTITVTSEMFPSEALAAQEALDVLVTLSPFEPLVADSVPTLQNDIG